MNTVTQADQIKVLSLLQAGWMFFSAPKSRCKGHFADGERRCAVGFGTLHTHKAEDLNMHTEQMYRDALAEAANKLGYLTAEKLNDNSDDATVLKMFDLAITEVAHDCD